MNREEKHELVSQLYKEGKTMREISKEVHMSFSDISSIIKKLNGDLEPKRKEISKESLALKLFRKGKDPVDVAITLDLSPSAVAEIYKEFWKLRGLCSLLHLFERVKPDISLLLRVNDVVKKYHLTKKDIIHIVNYADERIFLKEDIEELREQFDSLLKQRHDANDALQSAVKKLQELTNQIDIYSEISAQKNRCIENLDNEIKKLETHISKLKNSDEYYAKFEQYAIEKFDSIIKDHRSILALALGAAIESIRKDPDKQMIINDVITNETHQNKLLGLSEEFFEKILQQLIDGSLQLETTPDINGVNTPSSVP